MKNLFYFDTSIWLDFFENRDELNFKKSQLVHKLLDKIIDENNKILYSDINLIELKILGYSTYELKDMFKELKAILVFLESTKQQVGKAKDISLKRNIPKRDALHALIARDSGAVLITYDKHFQKTLEIIKPKKPQDFI